MSDFAAMLSQLARSKDVSAEKMNAVIAAVESERQRAAERAFTEAFLKLQAELPEIDENGAMFRDGKEISKYSKWEDIQRAIKPLCQKYEFTLNFHNDFPAPGFIEVVAVLTHKDGHHMENAVRLRADDSMANENQAMGSSQSYAMRYGVLGLLNVVTRGQDVDMGERPATPELPESEIPTELRSKYLKAIKTWTKAASKGTKALARSISHSPDEMVSLLMEDRARLAALKETAQSAETKNQAAAS